MDSLLPALWGPGGYLIKIQEIFKKPDLGESWKGSCFMDIASALFNRAFEELAEFRIALQELLFIQIVNMPAICLQPKRTQTICIPGYTQRLITAMIF